MPEGPVPEDFLSSSREKYRRELAMIPDAEPVALKKLKAAYYEQSFYNINQLLLGGKIVYQDKACDYLSRMAAFLLQDQPELFARLRFYVVKHPSANAFTTGDGIVLVNAGLLAQIENEAQLALILCHEISHYAWQHPINLFLESRKRSSPQPAVPGYRPDSYSQEKELEADSLGFLLFARSGYSLSDAIGIFDLMKESEEALDGFALRPDLLRVPFITLADTLFQAPAPAQTPPSRPDPGSNTHPDPLRRKKALLFLSKTIHMAPGEGFLLSEADFTYLRRQCRTECANLYLAGHQYEKALAMSLSLLEECPHPHIQKLMAAALYGLSRYRNAGLFWDTHSSYEDARGALRDLLYFTEKIADDELNLLALSYVWVTCGLLENDPELLAMTEDLLEDLLAFHIGEPFRLPENQQTDQTALLNPGIYAAIEVLTQDTLFARMLSRRIDVLQQARPTTPAEEGISPKGFRMGLGKVVYIEPYYQKTDRRLNPSLHMLEADDAEQRFIGFLQQYSEGIGLSYHMLSKRRLKYTDSIRVQEIVLLDEWIQEKNHQDALSLVSMNQEEVKKLAEKYGTPYFIHTGINSTLYDRRGRGIFLAGGMIFPPALPFAIYKILKPEYMTHIRTQVYDLEKGVCLLQDTHTTRMKDNRDVLSMLTYNLVYQLHMK